VYLFDSDDSGDIELPLE